MNSNEIAVLRAQMVRCYEHGTYREAARCMRQLEVLGDQSKGWWVYSLMLAGALGDPSIVGASLRVLERDRTALVRALKASWSNAVRERHIGLAKDLSRHLLRFSPADTYFRVLNLLDLLEAGDASSARLRSVVDAPLPLNELDPELLRILVAALLRAGFEDDAGRMLDYLVCKFPGGDVRTVEQTALLACYLKRPNLALSLTNGREELRCRYVRSLACLTTLAWDELKRSQLNCTELRNLLSDDPDWRPAMLWKALMLPAYTNANHLALARRANLRIRSEPGEFVAHVRPASRPARLRIAYLSGDFKRHPCTQLACPVFESHNRQRFEVFAFDNSRDDASSARRRVLATFDHVLGVRTLSDADLAVAIREARIDVLVDMSGHTTDSRVEVLAYRPAPVQITWLGFPGGVGGSLADYLLVDEVSAPIGSDPDFDEALIRLPHSYLPGGEFHDVVSPPERQIQGLPDDALVLACFNQHTKISEETFSSWCEILRAVPGSVLWLMDEGVESRTTITLEAVKRGVKVSRLCWAARTRTHEEHVRRVACADLILDSHPYTMHTTAVDALAAGVPFLTFCGETVASRVSSSLLLTMGLDDCVCKNVEDYVNNMVELACNLSKRLNLRDRFRAARATSPLFSATSFVRSLELAYDQAFARWISGNSPEQIRIETGGFE